MSKKNIVDKLKINNPKPQTKAIEKVGVKKVNIREYTPKSDDVFFFDNNVWMYLFCAIGNHNADKQSVYSSFFEKVIQSKASICVNSMVLSEFANAWFRLNFKTISKDLEKKARNEGIAPTQFNFKQNYIPTDDYKQTSKAIKAAINNILKCTERFSDNFNAIDMQIILNNISTIDFNDCYYEQYCQLDNYKLVTDDKDFLKLSDSKITVLTI